MKSLEDLKRIKAETEAQTKNVKYRVVVGMATCGITAGANPVFEALSAAIKENNLTNVDLEPVGCKGECALEPIVEVYDQDGSLTTYCRVDAKGAKEIFEQHILNGKIVDKLLISAVKDVNAAYAKQIRIVLRNCGIINPRKVEEYIAHDGYFALNKALTQMTPTEVIDEIKKSGLRGRGGGGFPTGLKWSFAAGNQGPKFMICNADEGDPGAFMDRSVLEGDPHSVIEAMAIAGYAIGANQGYVYVRAEYPLAVERLNYAIKQCYEEGYLGKNIFGTDFSFDLECRLGAGAFVCGEETALIASIEGERGMPRNKPPFPANEGLWKRPTIINNVETYANIAQIIFRGADWFTTIGTEKSKGTKVFALGGKINNTGLLEIPMGTTLREVIYEIGGGIPNGKAFKAVQTGGPSGGCLTAKHLDTPIDYDNLIALGSMMGSGGMIVMDEDNCMVDVARFFLDFTVDESCGKCIPCREGTRRMLEILLKITKGDANLADLDALEQLALSIKDSALCGLGQTAPNPVLSTLANFRDEYIAHVVDKKCPAGVCKSLIKYYVTDKCIGCGLCKKNCPTGAISLTNVVAKELANGNKLYKHIIDVNKCIKCGACKTACKSNAIITA